MKKKLLILLGMLLFSQFGFSLSCVYRGYEKVENKIYYYKNHKEKIELEDVDYDTFKVIDSAEFVHYNLLAKDKNNVYWQGKKLEGVNSKTFIIAEEIKLPLMGQWGYGCKASSYIIEDKERRYELKERFQNEENSIVIYPVKYSNI